MPWVTDGLIRAYRDQREAEEETRRKRQYDEHAAAARLYPRKSGMEVMPGGSTVFDHGEEAHAHGDGRRGP